MREVALRAAAWIAASAAWAGLAVQFAASFDRAGSVHETLWILLRYFTILTNLAVAVVLSGVAFGATRLRSPALLGGITLWILLVGIVYGLLLRGTLELSGGAILADRLLHVATPLLVPLFWLIFAPKGGLSRADPWLWSLFPLAYFVYALARGVFEAKYAYPFLDTARIGWLQTGINGLAIAFGFLLGGFALVWLDSVLARRERG